MRGIRDNSLSEADIIQQAKEAFGDGEPGRHPVDLLNALEAFYMNGLADESDGDVDAGGHFYRVHRWIVHTDSQGFHDVETHDSEHDATVAFERYAAAEGGEPE